MADQPMYENVTLMKGQGEDPTPWLHGLIERTEVADLMTKHGNVEGLFLIRDSSKRVGDHILSVYNGKVQHYVITNTNGIYSIDDGPKFTNLPQLVDYYTNTSDRLPTRLTIPILRVSPSISQDTSYEPVWNASASTQAQVGQMSTMTMGKNASFSSGAPPILSRSASTTSSSSAKQPIQAPVTVARVTETLKKATLQAPAGTPANRDNFKNLASVKKWTDSEDAINNVSIKVVEEKTRALPEGFAADANERAAAHAEVFSKAAIAEEKMYLHWMNNQLKKLDKNIPDISASLKDGILILEALKMVSGKPAPMYSKRPSVMQQMADNWVVVIKWMRKLGIQVDASEEDTAAGVDNSSLDATKLFELDRREILKLFSRILNYENKLQFEAREAAKR